MVDNISSNNLVITGAEFVKSLALNLSPHPQKIRDKVRGSYRVGSVYGVYKVVTELVRYSIYRCLHDNVKIKFKEGSLEFGKFGVYKHNVILDYKKSKYKGYDYNNKDLILGGIQILPNKLPYKFYNEPLTKSILQGEIRINGELNEQIVQIVNSGAQYWSNKKILKPIDIIKEVHWYFPMYSELELEQILKETLRVLLVFYKRDIPYDLTWNRQTKKEAIVMMRSFHTTDQKVEFGKNKTIIAAVLEQEALRRKTQLIKQEVYIRDYRNQSNINKKTTTQNITDWNNLFKKNLVKEYKTTEELLDFYSVKQEKETLVSLLQKNTNKDLRHYLLDLL